MGEELIYYNWRHSVKKGGYKFYCRGNRHWHLIQTELEQLYGVGLWSKKSDRQCQKRFYVDKIVATTEQNEVDFILPTQWIPSGSKLILRRIIDYFNAKGSVPKSLQERKPITTEEFIDSNESEEDKIAHFIEQQTTKHENEKQIAYASRLKNPNMIEKRSSRSAGPPLGGYPRSFFRLAVTDEEKARARLDDNGALVVLKRQDLETIPDGKDFGEKKNYSKVNNITTNSLKAILVDTKYVRYNSSELNK